MIKLKSLEEFLDEASLNLPKEYINYARELNIDIMTLKDEIILYDKKSDKELFKSKDKNKIIAYINTRMG